MNEQQIYDVASVMSSLGKIKFFENIDADTKVLLQKNIDVLEKLLEAEEKK